MQKRKLTASPSPITEKKRANAEALARGIVEVLGAPHLRLPSGWIAVFVVVPISAVHRRLGFGVVITGCVLEGNI